MNKEYLKLIKLQDTTYLRKSCNGLNHTVILLLYAICRSQEVAVRKNEFKCSKLFISYKYKNNFIPLGNYHRCIRRKLMDSPCWSKRWKYGPRLSFQWFSTACRWWINMFWRPWCGKRFGHNAQHFYPNTSQSANASFEVKTMLGSNMLFVVTRLMVI